MPEPVPLKCPNCGSVLRSEDVDLSIGIVKCGYCKALSALPAASPAPGAPAFRPRAELPLPKGMTIDDHGSHVVITRRWFSAVVFVLIPFCIFWNGFLAFWYGIAFKANAPMIMKIVPLAHVAIGLGLTYFVAAILVNRTVIGAGQGLLRIGHGPLPWPGNAELAADDIGQLYCKEVTHRGKNGTSVSYELWASMRNAPARKLLGSTLTQDQALFVEQKLEQALGIKDRPVAGEIPR